MKKFKVGIQLYSLRDEMEKDMDATLKAVKEMGYDCVEFAGYFGRSAEEVRAMLDKYGLECVSVHQTPSLFVEEGQKAVDYLKTIGAKYAAIPWYDADKLAGTPEWENTVEMFKQTGKLLADNGIQQLYHNHDFEFKKVDGKFLLDWLYETLPQEYLQPQVDTCWVHYAGYNPAEYLEKYIMPQSIARIFLNFSCPFPKAAYATHRLTHLRFLEIYKRIMKKDAEIHQKTDNMHFFEYSIEKYSELGFKMQNVSLDLHNSGFEGNIITEYEQRFLDLGQPIYRLEAINQKEQ